MDVEITRAGLLTPTVYIYFVVIQIYWNAECCSNTRSFNFSQTTYIDSTALSISPNSVLEQKHQEVHPRLQVKMTRSPKILQFLRSSQVCHKNIPC